MKRFFTKSLALALIVMLLLSLCSAAFAFDASVLSSQKLKVNGEEIDCEKYNIDGNNYFKLRDLAKALNGTESQFAVDWDAETKTVSITTGEPYVAIGGELEVGEDKSASTVVSSQTIKIDGETVTDLAVYNIGGNNYFKLRDLGPAVHFYVHYDEATRTMLVDEQEEDEAWDTGDASKDLPRNEDGIGETEVLVVSFGTSFNDSRVATIGAIEAAMEKAFPGYSVRRGFTANIVIDHIALRDDEHIDDIDQALQRAIDNGVKNLLVQPTHLMAGFEYDDVVAAVEKVADKFDKVVIGKQILDTDEDFNTVINAITEATAKQAAEEGTAICFMGHGTEHKSNAVYAKLQDMLTEAGYENYFIGTVEAEPSLQDVVDAVKAAGYKKVYVEPLMIVAGDHANNDMADPEDEESWVSLFAAAGIEAEPILRGLGELPAIQDLLVEHLKTAAAEALDENYDTGDASLDKPRNEDGIGEKELLVVSFGTSFNDSRVATIGAIEAAMEKAFPELSVRRGFTANIVIDHVKERDGEIIDDIDEALERAVANGVKELYVQPTHLMAGYEYDDVVAAVNGYKDKFDKVVIGKQILDTDEDFNTVIKAITEATAAQAKEADTAVCFMGHGTEHASNAVYAKLQDMLTEAGYENYFIGTVEAEPSLQDVVDAVKAAGYKKVYVEPLMIVAGDHANNDMADPEDEESWVSLFAAAGIEAEPILRGLGELPAIQQLLVSHMKAAMEGTVTVDAPTRDINKTSDKSVEKEGAAPITADKLVDGTYDITVNTGADMFKVASAKLTVANGKMTAKVTLSGSGAYTWFFVGEKEAIATAADSEFIQIVDKTFEITVDALDQVIPCAAYSKNKDAWYPRNILFDSATLPEGALKA